VWLKDGSKERSRIPTGVGHRRSQRGATLSWEHWLGSSLGGQDLGLNMWSAGTLRADRVGLLSWPVDGDPHSSFLSRVWSREQNTLDVEKPPRG
jgi:hypothetical protein